MQVARETARPCGCRVRIAAMRTIRGRRSTAERGTPLQATARRVKQDRHRSSALGSSLDVPYGVATFTGTRLCVAAEPLPSVPEIFDPQQLALPLTSAQDVMTLPLTIVAPLVSVPA